MSEDYPVSTDRITVHRCLASKGAASIRGNPHLGVGSRDARVERGPFGLGIVGMDLQGPGHETPELKRIYVPEGRCCPYCGEKIPHPNPEVS
jgi:hypothetical protein